MKVISWTSLALNVFFLSVIVAIFSMPIFITARCLEDRACLEALQYPYVVALNKLIEKNAGNSFVCAAKELDGKGAHFVHSTDVSNEILKCIKADAKKIAIIPHAVKTDEKNLFQMAFGSRQKGSVVLDGETVYVQPSDVGFVRRAGDENPASHLLVRSYLTSITNGGEIGVYQKKQDETFKQAIERNLQKNPNYMAENCVINVTKLEDAQETYRAEIDLAKAYMPSEDELIDYVRATGTSGDVGVLTKRNYKKQCFGYSEGEDEQGLCDTERLHLIAKKKTRLCSFDGLKNDNLTDGLNASLSFFFSPVEATKFYSVMADGKAGTPAFFESISFPKSIAR